MKNTIERGGIMGTVEESIEINASPERVFDYLTDLGTHTRWNSGLLKIAPIVRLTIGQTYHSEFLQVGRVLTAENTVTELELGRVLTIVNQTGPLRYEVSYLLRPSPDGCKLTYQVNITSNLSIFGMAEDVIKQVVSSKLCADLLSLKALIEVETQTRNDGHRR